MECKGKNVLYIGGFGGIGEKCCEEFLKKEILNLVICDLKQNDECLKYLQTTYGKSKVHYVPIDVAQKESIETAFKMVIDIMGHLDIVVNGSGIFNECLIDLTVAVNLTGVIHSTLKALSYMDKSKGGSGGVIVNISSVAGIEPIPMSCTYTATKFGLTGFTRALADPLYHEATGVSFITICPGLTLTPILADLDTKMTLPEYAEPFLQRMKKYPSQTAEQFAKSFIEIIEMADNGSVWLVDDGKYEQKKFPVMWDVLRL